MENKVIISLDEYLRMRAELEQNKRILSVLDGRVDVETEYLQTPYDSTTRGMIQVKSSDLRLFLNRLMGTNDLSFNVILD